MTSGERSQDVWILSEAAVEEVSLLPPRNRPVELRRTSTELSSRVADNLLWLGRYMERADVTCRFLRTVVSELVDAGETRDVVLPLVLRVLAEQGQIEPGYVVPDLSKHMSPIEQVLPATIFDASEPRSMRSIILQAVRLASTVRDRLALDTWRIVHRLKNTCDHAGGNISLAETSEVLDQIITELNAFAGLIGESMTRTLAWCFLDLGRRLERAWQTAFVLRVTLSRQSYDERPILEALLRATDSIMTYRMRYLASVHPAAVLDLLLVDETNPRSIGFQLARIEEHIRELPRDAGIVGLSGEQRLVLSLQNSVRLAEVYGLVVADADGDRHSLRKLLARLNDQLQRLGEALASKYLIHAGLPRHFASVRRRHA
jgi:uncharacterized alpha-E superfamily protein